MADKIFSVVQQISAGSQFNKAVPTTTPVVTDGVKVYPVDTVGGKVDPGHVSPMLIKEFLAGGGGAATGWTVTMTDGTTVVHVFEASNLNTLSKWDLVILPVGWWLEVVTTGAAQAMTLWAAFERAHVLM